MTDLALEFGATFIINGKRFRLQQYAVNEGENGQSINIILLDDILFGEIVENKASTKKQREHLLAYPELIKKTNKLYDHFLRDIDEDEKWKG